MKKTDSDNRNTSHTYRTVLTIAGSDSGGGAGIQADLKTFSAMGCFGMSVITALTAQNTKGVTGIHPVPPAFVEKQMEAVFSDIGVDAVKIGMLYSAELIETVAQVLKKYKIDKIVLDPVMVAQSGDKLLEDNAIEAIKIHLMPLSMVVTPNLPEASVLLNCKLHGFEDIKKGAKDLSVYGSQSVLIKGGHLKDNDSTDFLYLAKKDRFVVLKGERINTKNNHGTGCTLSSAIASCMAKGCGIEEAVRKAKTYINEAIRAGSKYKIGHGHGPVHHFYKFWE
jgi:hydroxymethylpyrimidine kinase/phosphomethylpyrimidine kinase